MKSFKTFLKEALKKGSKDTVVFAFGRFNPPSIGHLKLIKMISSEAQQENADAKIFTSRSVDYKKNPLEYKIKVEWLNELIRFNKVPLVKVDTSKSVKTPFEVVEQLAQAGYKNIIMISGEDRITEFSKAEKYAKENGAETFEVRSSGARDPDAEGVEGVSASKLRKFVEDDDIDSFIKSVPFSKSDAKLLFNDVKEGMGLTDDIK